MQIFGGRRLFVRYTAPLVDISSKKSYRLVGKLLIKKYSYLSADNSLIRNITTETLPI